jgi:hypothetical protein
MTSVVQMYIFFANLNDWSLCICKFVLHLQSENETMTYGVMVALQFLDLPV